MDHLDEERAPIILQTLAQEWMEGTISSYFRSAFRSEFKPELTRTDRHENVIIDTFGILNDQEVVEVAFVDDEERERGPSADKIAAAVAKAFSCGQSTAYVLLIDKNIQRWTAYKLTEQRWAKRKAFRQLALQVFDEVDLLHESLTDEYAAGAHASPKTCQRCPFYEICEADRLGDPEPWDVTDIAVRRDSQLTQKLDARLDRWSKGNHGDYPRISPSHFSTTECDRAVAYNLLGTRKKGSPEAGLRRIFDMGHAYHEILQEALPLAWPDIEVEIPLQDSTLMFEGHADGFSKTEELVFEIKTISYRGFDKLTKPKPEHIKQALLYARMAKAKTILFIYINKQSGELKTFEVAVDSHGNNSIWGRMAARARSILTKVRLYGKLEKPDPDMLPERIVGKDSECKKCRYAWICRPGLIPTRGFHRR